MSEVEDVGMLATALEISFDAGRYEWFCPNSKCDLLIACNIETVVVGFAEIHMEKEHVWEGARDE